jgi:hypothetical protein
MVIPKIGDIIKHKNFSDVALEVIKFKRYSQDYYSVKAKWINLGYNESKYIGINKNLKIKDEDMKDWLICLDPGYKCYRYSDWEPISG